MNKKDFNFLGYKPEGFIAKKHRIAKTYRFHSAQFFGLLPSGARLDSKIFITPLYKWTFLSRVLSDTLCPLEYLLQ